MPYKYKPADEQADDCAQLDLLQRVDKEEYFYELQRSNKLSIRNVDMLQKAERAISGYRNDQLEKSFIPGDFDFEHFKRVHGFLFGDIYYFAGQLRTMNMEIDPVTKFTPAKYIQREAQRIFAGIKKDNYLKGLNKSEFIAKLAKCLTEINILHPFREGNGRSKRTFFKALARQAGYDVRFSSIEQEQWLAADSAAFDNARDGQYNDEYLRVLLDIAVVPL